MEATQDETAQQPSCLLPASCARPSSVWKHKGQHICIYIIVLVIVLVMLHLELRPGKLRSLIILTASHCTLLLNQRPAGICWAFRSAATRCDLLGASSAYSCNRLFPASSARSPGTFPSRSCSAISPASRTYMTKTTHPVLIEGVTVP